MGSGYVRQEAANIITGNTIEASHLNNEFNALLAAFDASTGHSHDGTPGEGPQISLTASVSGTLPVANGGTNATTASAARTSLGVAIGTDVQAYNAELGEIAAITPVDGDFLKNVSGTWTVVNESNFEINKLRCKNSTNQILLDSDAANTGTISMATLSSDQTYTFPDETGTVILDADQASASSLGIASFSPTYFTVTAGDVAIDDATTTGKGISELATTTEINTGTDTGRTITPGALSDSNYGLIPVSFPSATTLDTSTGDGWSYFHVPSTLNGMDLVSIEAFVATAGTTGTTDIQVHNVTDAVDMLSTVLTIDSTETNSSTAATPAVINTATDDVATGDVLRIDIDAVSTTPAKGLVVILYFRIP